MRVIWHGAAALVHCFVLDMEDAYDLLQAAFNPRCRPAWSGQELRKAVQDAAENRHSPG